MQFTTATQIKCHSFLIDLDFSHYPCFHVKTDAINHLNRLQSPSIHATHRFQNDFSQLTSGRWKACHKSDVTGNSGGLPPGKWHCRHSGSRTTAIARTKINRVFHFNIDCGSKDQSSPTAGQGKTANVDLTCRKACIILG